jgi:hypothetical protein
LHAPAGNCEQQSGPVQGTAPLLLPLPLLPLLDMTPLLEPLAEPLLLEPAPELDPLTPPSVVLLDTLPEQASAKPPSPSKKAPNPIRMASRIRTLRAQP